MTFFIVKAKQPHSNMILFYVLIALCLLATSAFAESVIIVNPQVTDSALSKDDIEKIYTGKKSKWSDGSKVIPVTLDIDDVHGPFLKKYVSKSPSQFKAYWKKMTFTGKGKPPEKFDSEEALIDYVAKTDGAIGYVSSTSVKVKQINVSE